MCGRDEPGEPDGRHQQDIERFADGVVIKAARRSVDAGYQRVDAAEALGSSRYEALAVLGIRQIAGNRKGIIADLGGSFPQRGFVARGHHDSRAFTGEDKRGRLADATRGAGNDRHFTGESEVHPSSFAQRGLS